MLSTAGVELLIREGQLTDKRWRDLVEARRKLVKPFLDSLTLPELGALRCLKTEHYEHELSLSGTVTGDDRFSFKTQGIFGVASRKSIPGSGYQAPPGGRSCPDGTMKIWGLTRGGLWILVTASYAGTYGWKGRGQELAQTIEVQEADLDTILAKTGAKPQYIWEEIGEAVKGWLKRSAILYGRVVQLAERVKAEETIVWLISEKQ